MGPASPSDPLIFPPSLFRALSPKLDRLRSLISRRNESRYDRSPRGNLMRIFARLFAILVLVLLPGVSVAGPVHFDGSWQTTVSCEPSRGALGFSYRFLGEVKGGNFHGLHGAENQPGYLMVDGAIGDDGSANLYATGKTGAK